MKASGARIRPAFTPALLALGALLVSLAAQERHDGVYVGTEICLRCHIDYAELWASLTHSQAMLSPTLPEPRRGCEACHGPGGDHVAGRRSTIVQWDKLSLDRQSAICLQCHDGLVSAAHWVGTTHAELLSCTRCHEVHYPVAQDDLLKQPINPLCEDCHDLAAAVAAGTHHPLADGGLICDLCHDAHGTDHQHLLLAPQEEICADCHGDEVPKPANHEQPGWRLGHGDEARGRTERCLMCHDQEAFCNQCHAVSIPHPENFALKHTEPAQRHPQTCLRCHEAKYCQLCHDEVPAVVAEATKR